MQFNRKFLGHLYMVLFLVYLLLPLAVMSGAAFNASKLPTIIPWKGFTDQWFIALYNDKRIWNAVINTVLVALAVVVIAVPVGAAGAILVNSISGRVRAILYGMMVAPILVPGVVIGISTLLFWHQFSVGSGLHLSVLGQVSYIASFVMLLVLARLQSFDQGLEEAALDLGGSIRVGREDNLYLPSGEMAASNGELVAVARQMTEAAGRRPATVAEARGLLGITAPVA